MNRERVAALAAALVFACAVAVAGFRMTVNSNTLMGDFRAFYCAARVTVAHGDPYSVAPMEACETAPVAKPLFRPDPPLEIPAPLPGYLIAIVIPFSVFPYSVAAILWFLTLAATGVAACALLARLGWVTLPTGLVALAIPLFAVSLPVGELPPIALLGIVVAVYAIREQKPWLVGGGVALCMAEPQIGLPLGVALACADRRTWLPLACGFAALATLSLALLGWGTNVEYVTAFVPAHVASELPRVQQYTIAWVLHFFGASTDGSLLVGKIVYALVLGASAVIGRLCGRRDTIDVACVFVPVLALLGGPFVHVDHLIVAFPAAFWCARRTGSRMLGTFAIAALALPLATVFSYRLLVCAVPIVSATAGREYFGNWLAALRVAGASTVTAIAIYAVCARYGFGLVNAAGGQSGSGTAWSRYVLAHNVVTSWTIFTIKGPMWAALGALAARGYVQWRRSGS